MVGHEEGHSTICGTVPKSSAGKGRASEAQWANSGEIDSIVEIGGDKYGFCHRFALFMIEVHKYLFDY